MAGLGGDTSPWHDGVWTGVECEKGAKTGIVFNDIADEPQAAPLEPLKMELDRVGAPAPSRVRLLLKQTNVTRRRDAFFLGGDREEEILRKVFGQVRVDAVDIDHADIDDGAAADRVPGFGDPGLLDEDADQDVQVGHAGLLQLDDGDEGDGLAESPEERDAELGEALPEIGYGIFSCAVFYERGCQEKNLPAGRPPGRKASRAASPCSVETRCVSGFPKIRLSITT